MTIQRQYSLPNCTLVLEGLGDPSITSSDPRPLMSILINAECYLAGQSLSGGREFFESLVSAVNQYAQEILSGIHRFGVLEDKSQLVRLRQIDSNHHRLSVQSSIAQTAGAVPPDTDIDLTTVQVFDLVEAVDQFFADAQTLPDLSLQLVPLPKRFIRREASLTKQAVPIAIGVSSVAVAAIAFFWMPVPKVKEPADVLPQPGATSTTSTPGASPPVAGSSPNPSPTSSPAASPSPITATSPSPATTPNLAELEAVFTSAPEITDPAQLEALRKQLYSQIDNAWKERTPFVQDLVYRVGVGKDGAIVGYKPVNDAALTNASKTPLLNLLYIPTTGVRPGSEPIAQFQVKFTPSGLLEVTPWQQAMPSPLTGAPEITDAAVLEELQPKLRSQILQAWENTDFRVDKELIFRVRVRQDGTVVDYRPENESAIATAQTVPISKLAKLMADGDSISSTQESLALFKVVFTPNGEYGKLEITPWRGWRS
jgi:hypothetical protein